jgi:hypothetical protein
MICEISDGDLAPRERQVPKYVKLAMFEGKYGFLLEPVCVLTSQKVEIHRVVIPKTQRTPMQYAFGGEETWQVQVWEYAEGHNSVTPTWTMTYDPDTTREEVEKEAAKVLDMYGDFENNVKFAQVFRPAEPRISLPPEKPIIDPAKDNSERIRELHRRYEIHREERSARFKVLSAILPKTVGLAEMAEQVADDVSRREIEVESLEAYFAENAPGWSPIVFKAWQHLNPIGFKWVQWLYVWHSRQMKNRKEIDMVDYELAFNWRWEKYYLMTAEQLKDAVYKRTNQKLTAEAIKKRRERLGLTTQRPPGPPPKELESTV